MGKGRGLLPSQKLFAEEAAGVLSLSGKEREKKEAKKLTLTSNGDKFML